MKIGDRVRFKLTYCIGLFPEWFANIGTIVKLEPNRKYWHATIIWEIPDLCPQTSFTFNLELVE